MKAVAFFSIVVIANLVVVSLLPLYLSPIKVVQATPDFFGPLAPYIFEEDGRVSFVKAYLLSYASLVKLQALSPKRP